MAAEGKPIIFVTPLSENLIKLRDTIQSDEAYTIYEIETAADYAQMAPAVGASLTVSSDIKKLAKILNENKKTIKKYNCKVLLLHNAKLPHAVTQKLEKLGLNEVLYEPIIPKTLLYKVSLLAKSLKNPVVKDTSDIVLKSKNEAKTESEVKVDKDQASKSTEKQVSAEFLTAAADQKIAIDDLTQDSSPEVAASKMLSVEKEASPINNKMDLQLNSEENPEQDINLNSKYTETLAPLDNNKKNNSNLEIADDSSEKEKAHPVLDEVPSNPSLKKNINLATIEDALPLSKKNILESTEEAKEKTKEKFNDLPLNEKAELKTNALDLLEAEEKKKSGQLEVEEAETVKKAKLQEATPIPAAEKTQQQKLEEKREKLRKLKQMAQELKTDSEKTSTNKEGSTFNEIPELGTPDTATQEMATKALREKKIKDLEELSKKKLGTLDINEPSPIDVNRNKIVELEDKPDKKNKNQEEVPEFQSKKRKSEIMDLESENKSDKNLNLNLINEDEATNDEEKSKLDDDLNARKKDHSLDLADDEKSGEDEKSKLNEDDHERDRDFNLALEDEDEKKKKRHEESTTQGPGFKVKKEEIDANWDYDNIGKQEDNVINTGEGETINYSEFKEYQESTSSALGTMKRKRKVYGEKAGEVLEGQEGYENFDKNSSGSFEEIVSKQENNESVIENEIALRLEEMIAQQEKEIPGSASEDFIKAAKLEAIEEVLSKVGKEYTPDKIESIKKKMVEITLDEIYGKKSKDNVIEKAEAFKKKTGKSDLTKDETDSTKTASFDAFVDKKNKMPVINNADSESDKIKTEQFYAPDSEKTKTKSFYKDDEPENVIRYGKKAEIFIPKDKNITSVTEDEIIIEKPYVPFDTKGLEYIAGVRTLHYWEIFEELKILDFIANKIMISKNALTTFYYKNPNTNVFERAYSGHQECLEAQLYLGMDWSEFEKLNRENWEKTNLPTWQDPTFTQEMNLFIFPFYEQEAQLGFAVLSFIGQIKNADEAKTLENVLSASRCYFLFRYHQSLGIELEEKVVEEMLNDNVVGINILAKVKSFIKGIFSFMKKAA